MKLPKILRRAITNLGYCKELCRSRYLQVGGSKFDLILLLLQDNHNTGVTLSRERGSSQEVPQVHETHRPPKIYECV
eukprot:scaffold366812_cov41-Attheya_sp.AAC.2